MAREEEDEEFNYGSEFDRYVPPNKKVYKLSSSIPENLTASFQNLLNKRINDNYKVRKRRNLTECFTILKFSIIFVIFITTCKIITLFFNIDERVVQQQYHKSSHETVKICFYLIFSFALLVQLIESYAVVFDRLCLTFVFTSLEFVIIIWSVLDCYHSKDEHWLIFLWLIGLLLLIIHLGILYKMKFKSGKKPSKRNNDSIQDKAIHSESSDQLYVSEQDCSYRNFLKQQSYNQAQSAYGQPAFNQLSMIGYAQSEYVQSGFAQPDCTSDSEPESNVDMPNISTISKSISGKDDLLVDPNQVKFVNDEEEAHEKRDQLCKELLLQCQMKIFELEVSQQNNQTLLDKHQEQIEQQNKLAKCNGECNEDCAVEADCSAQTSELNSPKLSNEVSSSTCSDELTCKETSKIILNGMKNLEYSKYNCQE